VQNLNCLKTLKQNGTVTWPMSQIKQQKSERCYYFCSTLS